MELESFSGAARGRVSPGKNLMLWSLFFLICMGLGYPTLNRYDPRGVPGLYDTRAYSSMVTGDPLQEDQVDLSHRMLIPYLAKPVYWFFSKHLKTWNPAFFALLVTNSFFIATTACLLVGVGYRIVGNYVVGLLAGFLYLADFVVANLNLSGYVDSAVNCILLVIAWSLLEKRWWHLPLWGIVGALAKETFVPLAGVLAFGWWVVSYRRGTAKLAHLLWVGAMVAVGLVTVLFTMSHTTAPYTPLSFAVSRLVESRDLFLSGLVRCVLAREFVYTFVWLLPLGLFRLGRLPRTWVVGTACAAAMALALGAYDDALGNATRAVFSACGPLLSLSAAMLLAEAPGAERLNAEARLRDSLGKK